MENENMPSSTAPLARRPAVSGQTRLDKDQPALPPDANPTTTQRSATPTSGARGQRPPHKAPGRSTTMDQSTALAGLPNQAAQPSVPPGLPAPPILSDHSVSSVPTASVRRSPLDEWEAVGRPNTHIEEMQGKIAELDAVVRQQDAALRKQDAELKRQDAELKKQDAELKKCHDDIFHYRNQIVHLESDVYRQEVVSIRRHLQVDEPCEPWEITKRFGEIVRKIEDISRDMGEALGSSTPVSKPTTLSLLKQLLGESEGQSLAAATPAVDLDLEDFIDFGCRSLINEALYTSILDHSIFHPGLKADENKHFYTMYHQIRKQEPQVVSGQWRIATLKLHSNRVYALKEQVRHLCEYTLALFCESVVEPASYFEHIRSMIPRIEEVFELALKWNRLVKNSFVMLDFHPQYQPPGSLHDYQYTKLEGRKPKAPASKAILLTSKLGLWSSHAPGGGKDPSYSIQIEAMVLASEYFT
ncbi:unnamed protein product [Rhizoctonia solani]|uniref:Uncharacterized protein n=1 Tax=Rhizoctonia solani TaxID=456999 RepID=A0A8H3D658_9AGAM|nr:unnamed protein product [Rhizoctonia solani]